MQLFDSSLELVILDVDGVILELVEPLKRDLEAVAAEFDLPSQPVHDYFREVAAGRRHGFSNLLDEGVRGFWPWLTAEDASRFAWRFQAVKCGSSWPAIEGSVETVQWLQERGLPVALCTSNDRPTLARILGSIGVDLKTFAAASTWETGFKKPDPRCLDSIFETVPVPRAHALYVGDWYPDLETARGAGVRFIACLSGGIPRDAFLREGIPEDHIIKRLSDLPKLIQMAPR